MKKPRMPIAFGALMNLLASIVQTSQSRLRNGFGDCDTRFYTSEHGLSPFLNSQLTGRCGFATSGLAMVRIAELFRCGRLVEY